MKQMKIIITDELEEIIQTVMNENPTVTNKSSAVRFLLFQSYKDYEQSKSKVASMSKEVSMALEILSSMADSVHTKMKDRSDTSTYAEARELVEKRIKVNTSLRKYR